MSKLKLIPIFLLLLLAACDNKIMIGQNDTKNIEKEILFFSNEDHYKDEEMYYNAIIDLKEEYPQEFKQLKVIDAQQNKDELRKYNIPHSPAIVIIYHDKPVINIFGEHSKKEIVEPISKTLNHIK